MKPRYRNSLRGFVVGLLLIPTGCGTLGSKPDAALDDFPSHGPVGRTLKNYAPRFEACARDAVTIQTGTTQRIELHFMIAADGHTKKASVEKITDPDPDLQTCIEKAVRGVQFPKPKDGKTKNVVYPLTLRPK